MLKLYGITNCQRANICKKLTKNDIINNKDVYFHA